MSDDSNTSGTASRESPGVDFDEYEYYDTHALWLRIYPLFKRLARRMRVPQEDTKDVINEAFQNLLSVLPVMLRKEHREEGYAVVVFRATYISIVRRSVTSRHALAEEPAMVKSASMAHENSNTPDSVLLFKQLLDSVNTAEREVVLLRITDFSWDDIAYLRKSSRTAVISIWLEAIHRMKTRLGVVRPHSPETVRPAEKAAGVALDERASKIVKLRAEGKTWREVAAKLGVSQATAIRASKHQQSKTSGLTPGLPAPRRGR